MQWRFIVVTSLLVMLLMRLVWMQLRSFDLSTDYRTLTTMGFLEIDDRCTPPAAEVDPFDRSRFSEAKGLAAQSTYRWFVAPGYRWVLAWRCQGGEIRAPALRKTNQWMYVTIVALAVAVARLLTGSWVVALAGGVTLMSRGHLLGNIGLISKQVYVMAALCAWYLAMTHYVRTAAPIVLAGAMAVALVGGLFEESVLIVVFVLGAMLIAGFALRRLLAPHVIKRFRTEITKNRARVAEGNIRTYRGNVLTGAMGAAMRWVVGSEDNPLPIVVPERGLDYSPGSPLRTLSLPFGLWIFYRNRWKKLLALSWGGGALVLVVCFAARVWQYGEYSDVPLLALWGQGLGSFSPLWFLTWLDLLLEPVDLHYGLSLLVIMLCALQSPAEGLRSFFEACWMLIGAVVLVAIACLGLDYWDIKVLAQVESNIGSWSVFAWSRASEILIWFEPLVLVLAVSGAYHLLLIAQENIRRSTLE